MQDIKMQSQFKIKKDSLERELKGYLHKKGTLMSTFHPSFIDVCLIDAEPGTLKQWGRLQSKVIDNLTSVSVYCYT